MTRWKKIKPEEKAIYLAWYEGRSLLTHVLIGEDWRDSVKNGFWMKMREKDYLMIQELITDLQET